MFKFAIKISKRKFSINLKKYPIFKEILVMTETKRKSIAFCNK